MTETDSFLKAYKRLEKSLNCIGMTPLTYEQSMDDHSDKQDKLKTCRIIRNYLSHHNDGTKLFAASKGMTKFIDELSDKVERQYLNLGKLAVKTPLLTSASKLKDAAAALAILSKNKSVKYDYHEVCIPYLDNDGNLLMVTESFVLSCIFNDHDTWSKKIDANKLKKYAYPYTIATANLQASDITYSCPVVVIKKEVGNNEAITSSNYVGIFWKSVDMST